MPVYQLPQNITTSDSDLLFMEELLQQQLDASYSLAMIATAYLVVLLLVFLWNLKMLRRRNAAPRFPRTPVLIIRAPISATARLTKVVIVRED
ncbi:unnamed protein product [Caenorhabditis angaria]|uniref:Uncharacterized protein n=1 Tax=Caenorhabditis angaria TaxID=860376 RepID=A0A9P1IYP7_9PELO|nr:unnamed protein product [Caenorhabditis angaria]